MTLLHHPVLGVTRDFPERTVEIWQRSGWEAVEPADESPTSVDEQPPDEGDPQTPDKED